METITIDKTNNVKLLNNNGIYMLQWDDVSTEYPDLDTAILGFDMLIQAIDVGAL